MPTLMLRRLEAGLLARLRAYADRQGLGQDAAAVALLDAGLRAHARAVTGGQARAATMSPEDRRRAAEAGGAATARGHAAASRRGAGIEAGRLEGGLMRHRDARRP